MAAQDAAISTYDPSEVGAIVGHRSYARDIKLDASTVYPKGQLLALKPSSTTLVYVKYVRGASDGTELAECILRRACITDASGNIVVGTASGGEFGPYSPSESSASAWFGGVFRTVDLVTTGANGLDAAAVAVMNGRLQRNGAELSF